MFTVVYVKKKSYLEKRLFSAFVLKLRIRSLEDVDGRLTHMDLQRWKRKLLSFKDYEILLC